MSEVTYFILYILHHNKERHQPFWSDPLNPIFCLSLIFLSGDAPFSPCAGATLACAGHGTFFIITVHNGLPQGDNLSCPPVKNCKEVQLTHSPA